MRLSKGGLPGLGCLRIAGTLTFIFSLLHVPASAQDPEPTTEWNVTQSKVWSQLPGGTWVGDWIRYDDQGNVLKRWKGALRQWLTADRNRYFQTNIYPQDDGTLVRRNFQGVAVAPNRIQVLAHGIPEYANCVGIGVEVLDSQIVYNGYCDGVLETAELITIDSPLHRFRSVAVIDPETHRHKTLTRMDETKIPDAENGKDVERAATLFDGDFVKDGDDQRITQCEVSLGGTGVVPGFLTLSSRFFLSSAFGDGVPRHVFAFGPHGDYVDMAIFDLREGVEVHELCSRPRADRIVNFSDLQRSELSPCSVFLSSDDSGALRGTSPVGGCSAGRPPHSMQQWNVELSADKLMLESKDGENTENPGVHKVVLSRSSR